MKSVYLEKQYEQQEENLNNTKIEAQYDKMKNKITTIK